MNHAWKITLAAGATAVSASMAAAAEFRVQPFVAVSEEYNDNILETADNRLGDYITHLAPGLNLTCTAPVLTGDLNYQLDQRLYARKHHGDETLHTIAAKGLFSSPERMIFLEVSDDYRRVSLDSTRDTSRESLLINQADRNSATVSPYVVLQVAPKTSLKGGYRYSDTRYFDNYGIDKIAHSAFFEASRGLEDRFSLNAGYSFTRETSDTGTMDQHQVYGGFRHEYGEKSFVFANGGYTWTGFDQGGNFGNLFWSAGLSHTFERLIARADTGVRYNEDPLRTSLRTSYANASLERPFDRGNLTLSASFSEYARTETDQLEARKYTATLQGRYELTSALAGRTALTAEKYEQPLMGGHTNHLLSDSGLTWSVTSLTSVTLSYIYSAYSSPDISADNRHVNRASIELRMAF